MCTHVSKEVETAARILQYISKHQFKVFLCTPLPKFKSVHSKQPYFCIYFLNSLTPPSAFSKCVLPDIIVPALLSAAAAAAPAGNDCLQSAALAVQYKLLFCQLAAVALKSIHPQPLLLRLILRSLECGLCLLGSSSCQTRTA
jgi:hypothetical protein